MCIMFQETGQPSVRVYLASTAERGHIVPEGQQGCGRVGGPVGSGLSRMRPPCRVGDRTPDRVNFDGFARGKSDQVPQVIRSQNYTDAGYDYLPLLRM